VKIFVFFILQKNPRDKFFYKFVNRQILWSPLTPEIFEKIVGIVFEKLGIENFWGVALFRFRPLGGAPFPHLTLGYFGPRDPDKNSFCLGGSPPIWGRYEFWPVRTLAYFFTKSYRQILEISS